MQVYKLKKIEKSIDDFKKISYNKIVGVTMLYTREIKLTFKRYVISLAMRASIGVFIRRSKKCIALNISRSGFLQEIAKTL